MFAIKSKIPKFSFECKLINAIKTFGSHLDVLKKNLQYLKYKIFHIFESYFKNFNTYKNVAHDECPLGLDAQ